MEGGRGVGNTKRDENKTKGNSVDVLSKTGLTLKCKISSHHLARHWRSKGAKVTLGHTSKSKLKAANCMVRPWSGIADGFDASR